MRENLRDDHAPLRGSAASARGRGAATRERAGLLRSSSAPVRHLAARRPRARAQAARAGDSEGGRETRAADAAHLHAPVLEGRPAFASPALYFLSLFCLLLNAHLAVSGGTVHPPLCRSLERLAKDTLPVVPKRIGIVHFTTHKRASSSFLPFTQTHSIDLVVNKRRIHGEALPCTNVALALIFARAADRPKALYRVCNIGLGPLPIHDTGNVRCLSMPAVLERYDETLRQEKLQASRRFNTKELDGGPLRRMQGFASNGCLLPGLCESATPGRQLVIGRIQASLGEFQTFRSLTIGFYRILSGLFSIFESTLSQVRGAFGVLDCAACQVISVAESGKLEGSDNNIEDRGDSHNPFRRICREVFGKPTRYVFGSALLLTAVVFVKLFLDDWFRGGRWLRGFCFVVAALFACHLGLSLLFPWTPGSRRVCSSNEVTDRTEQVGERSLSQ